ncbi:MAG: hypothetical protein OXI96_07050 [Acidimicrobiaceae bacterium]|nr:hypothetical protein [Acidimicrobiaceae bacterium]
MLTRSYENHRSPQYTIKQNSKSSLWRSDRGEGIISTAIAVLIVAFLGAAMWVAFDNIWGSAETSIREQIQIIGTEDGK